MTARRGGGGSAAGGPRAPPRAFRARAAGARSGQQADLLVVAHGPGRRARGAGKVSDPHRACGCVDGAHVIASWGSGIRAVARAARCDGRMSDTSAPAIDVAASTHSAVCMLA